MKFSVPTVWQDELIQKVNKEKVAEFYGKLDSDFVGGGRSSFLLPHVNKRRVREHIKQIHKENIKFNYLLNAVCMANSEFTIAGQDKLYRLLQWLLDIKVDNVIVGVPYLVQLIKRRFPQLKVYISSFAGINTVETAKRWEDLGADVITLDPITINREFQLLSQFRKAIRCHLQLVANTACIYGCPFWQYHATSVSHSSRLHEPSGGFSVDYCILSCKLKRLLEPMEFIRAGWIRPEDISYYEDVGIDSIKLVDRTRDMDTILLIVNAYTQGYYEGNLLDLFPNLSSDSTFLNKNRLSKLIRSIKYFLRPSQINIFRLKKYAKFNSALRVYIDNRVLDGFLERFLRESCRSISCENCDYCRVVAQKAVKIEPVYHKEAVEQFKEILEDIISGELFQYKIPRFRE